jgi:hypothetical protein
MIWKGFAWKRRDQPLSSCAILDKFLEMRRIEFGDIIMPEAIE